MWAGARATHGASRGKFCFEVKILDHLNVTHLPPDEPNRYVTRVGFSVDSSTMQLGEDRLSYGYDGTGNIFTNSQFQSFGEPFTAGDVILGAVNADSEQVQIGFAKNDKFLGWAYRVNRSELNGHSLFPHVLTKNVSFEVNMGQKEQPFFPLPDAFKDFTFIGHLPPSQRERGARPPNGKQDCEVLMMCGLPWAGKSTWVADYIAKYPAKKFNVLGSQNILDKMTVMGLPHPRKSNGRWDFLMGKAEKCIINMHEIGSKLKRNYILDRDNLFPSEVLSTMRLFEGFHRTAAVVLPTDPEYQKRNEDWQRLLKEEGKRRKIWQKYIRKMKAKYKVSELYDILNEVSTELQEEDKGPSKKKFKSNVGGSGFGFYSGQGSQSSPGFPPRSEFDGRDREEDSGAEPTEIEAALRIKERSREVEEDS